MKIVAIYLGEHELFDGSQTINFGGKHIYDFRFDGKRVYVTRNPNPEYISDFFIETKSNSKLSLVSAIVGQNGSGKSSILNVIRSKFKEYSYGFLHSATMMLVEKENESLPMILQNDFDEVIYKFNFEELQERGNYEELEIRLDFVDKDSFQTIYYSPHFDYSYNPNFDDLDKYDISFDKILERDLKELDNKDTNRNGWPYSPSEELLFQNSLRQILFLNSDVVNNNKYFKNIFGLPGHGRACLVFRGYKEKDEWNTPYSFRPVLNEIKEKLENELNDWHKLRAFNANHKVTNQLEINKYLLKRYVVKDFISVIESQMEKNNDFLSEGEIDFQDLTQRMKDLDGFSSFLLFIELSKISKYSNTFDVFNFKTISNLFELIYQEIESAKSEQEIPSNKKNLYADPENTIKILNLQRLFLSQLFEYYPKLKRDHKSDALLRDGSRIDGFINYLPTEKKLSSGENALLNLFSRLYDFIYSNISINNFLPSSENYVLLLDEADLGFHPQWKKQYITSLLNTIPYLFEEIKTKPTVQIIFTTHDSLTLSDIPNNNIVYLWKDEESKKARVLKISDELRPQKSFGANIHELLSNSFFLKTGHIGDFSKKKINWVIDELNHIIDSKKGKIALEMSSQKRNIIKGTILMAGDDIIRMKLLDMYYTAFKESEDLDNEIKRLEQRLSELRKRKRND